jgi:hypothetical protein
MNLLILFRIFFAKQHSMAIMQHYIFFLSREEKPIFLTILREESCEKKSSDLRMRKMFSLSKKSFSTQPKVSEEFWNRKNVQILFNRTLSYLTKLRKTADCERTGK